MTSKVYFLPWGRRGELVDFLKYAGLTAILRKDDSVAIKMHFGEKGNKGYVKPKFIEPIIKIAKDAKTRPFLTDTNTIYHGQRNNSVGHLALAAEHGFSLEKLGVPIVIADGVRGESYKEINLTPHPHPLPPFDFAQGRQGERGKCHFQRVKIARAIVDADAIIAVSHFKGHMLAGFGGAIKNLGMGCAARIGKFEMHSTVSPTVTIKKCTGCGACIEICEQGALEVVDGKITLDTEKCAGCGECVVVCGEGALRITWNEPGKKVQEKFAEYALGAVKNKKIFCITFVNHITPNCDCVSSIDEKPLTCDIGILASTDPVAIDQAAVDLVIKEVDILKKAHPNIDYTVQLAHAEKMGLGRRKYELIYLP